MHDDGPVEELHQGPQESDIAPFNTDDIQPNTDTLPSRIPRVLHEKLAPFRSSDSISQTATATDVLGSAVTTESRDGRRSTGDDNIRLEVEQLRRVVEMMGTQIQQQSQVVQQQSVPDDPPPIYPY
jgi:hypothetical protein